MMRRGWRAPHVRANNRHPESRCTLPTVYTDVRCDLPCSTSSCSVHEIPNTSSSVGSALVTVPPDSPHSALNEGPRTHSSRMVDLRTSVFDTFRVFATLGASIAGTSASPSSVVSTWRSVALQCCFSFPGSNASTRPALIGHASQRSSASPECVVAKPWRPLRRPATDVRLASLDASTSSPASARRETALFGRKKSAREFIFWRNRSQLRLLRLMRSGIFTIPSSSIRLCASAAQPLYPQHPEVSRTVRQAVARRFSPNPCLCTGARTAARYANRPLDRRQPEEGAIRLGES